MKKRCSWVEGKNEDYLKYHDEEWGVPVHDDRVLFEFLILEGAQAGLSWDTILKRRKSYREAFDEFDPNIIATYGEKKVEELLQNSGIIRNRLKVNSAIKNAKAFLEIQKEFGSFSSYIWSFVDNRPIQNRFENPSDIPAETEISKKISKALKKRGMSFVGPTIMYAYMQAVGMVNDHDVNCYRWSDLAHSSEGF